ncbi:MAG: hypothetical protein SA339_07950 [Methanomassiliicoccus sp.]|nr:hypothetical protein [Methanomassiliicoccus sp.]
MKRWRVVGIIAMLLAVSAVGWYVQKAVQDRSYSGNWGTSAGQGFDVYNIPLDLDKGNYVKFEVSSTDGRTLDVYLTDLDGLRAARSDQPFDFQSEYSAMNTTHVVREFRISHNSQVVVMSHDAGETVKLTSSTEQSPYPLGLMPVLQITGIVCLVANIGLFVLLLSSWTSYHRERAGRQ